MRSTLPLIYFKIQKLFLKFLWTRCLKILNLRGTRPDNLILIASTRLIQTYCFNSSYSDLKKSFSFLVENSVCSPPCRAGPTDAGCAGGVLPPAGTGISTFLLYGLIFYTLHSRVD